MRFSSSVFFAEALLVIQLLSAVDALRLPRPARVAMADEHFQQLNGRQQSITITTPNLRPRATVSLSPDGTCSGTTGFSCENSCCSRYGYCGNTAEHCGTGCQAAFGSCSVAQITSNSTTTTTTPSIPTVTGLSPDGTCGGPAGFKCHAQFGNCCSSSGYCGTTAAYCGQGCQPLFGTCPTTNVASNTGECGANNGKFTCAGGPFDGQCCSASGYCGRTVAHCAAGCQSAYGKCT